MMLSLPHLDSKNRRHFAAVRFALLAAASLWTSTAWAGHVTWFSEESQSLLFVPREGVDSPEAAVQELLAGPTDLERAEGISSAIPEGVALLDLRITEDGVVIDLSPEAAEGLDDMRSEMIFRQFLYTMSQFGLDSRVHVLVEGRLLSDYLSRPPPAIHIASPEVPSQDLPFKTSGLTGKRITLSEGHGYIWTGSAWATQRGIVCGNPQEDFRNLRLARYLRVFLENDGAYVQHAREHDLGRGNGPSGHPWWQHAAYTYLRDQGYACSVYASLTGSCSDTGSSHRGNDDIRSRPLASNLDSRGNTDILLSVHTNAFQGECYSGCPSGTGTYYMDQGEHEAWGEASRILAGHITLAVVAAANEADETRGDGAPWQCHGSCAPKYGNFGEIRIPRRPAALIELGFHDSCNTDAAVMDKAFFQSVTMWGMYKGVCDYFGATPTWPLYSSVLVSDSIPATMTAGESREVEIIFRNKSVLWHRDYGFKLAAGGDADPFAAARHELGSETIDNNSAHTFRFTFTAPSTPGEYETSWQMIREGHRRFGDNLTRIVQVVPEEEPCECTPGETEERPCGECGIQERVCGEDCYWQEYGPCLPDAGSECDTGFAGACSVGLWTCVDGLMECVAQEEPRNEICDGIDNSCNGLIDDGFPRELGNPPPAYAADLVESSAPASLLPEQSASVSVTFRNVGAMSWPADQVRLAYLPAEGGDQPVLGGPWSQTGIAGSVAHPVEPGGTATFDFEIVAPMTSGVASSSFQLISPNGEPIACPMPIVRLEVQIGSGVEIEPIHVHMTGSCGCNAGAGGGAGGFLWSLLLLPLLIRLSPRR